MRWIRRAPNGVLSIGSRIWLFTRVRTDDDLDYDEDDYPVIVAYRQFVLHAWALHILIEWRLRG